MAPRTTTTWTLAGERGALATSNTVELYDMRADIGERRNLASSYPNERDRLLDTLLAWIDGTQARFLGHRRREWRKPCQQ